MAKYYFKCEKCDKTIKKNPDYKGKILCQKCKKEKKNCLNCKKEIVGGKKISKYCSRKCSSKHALSGMQGRTLSKEHKEKLSKAAWNNKGNGYAKVKYYKIFCPHMGKEISVQGTYERDYAIYLNENNISWKRDKSVSLQYKRSGEDNIRNYYPDFLLIDVNIFIEVKGYFSNQDKLKMKLVKEQNSSAIIKMIFKEDIEQIRSGLSLSAL